MKDRYINYFKKRLVVLLILFIVVSFSFGISYSNFIYSSNNHRAVEMHISKLNYKISIDNIETEVVNVSPGNTIIEMQIESLNNINSNYKLIYEDNDNINIYYLINESSGIIESNSKLKLKLIIFNSAKNSVNCKFDIVGGYVNNPLDKILIPNGYNDVNRKIEIGDYIEYKTFNNEYNNNNINLNIKSEESKWRILDINNDGSIKIISENPISINNNSFKLSGAKGYNNSVYLLNNIAYSLYKTPIARNIRNLNLEDIEQYLKEKKFTYGDKVLYSKIDSTTNIPILWDEESKGIYNRSDDAYLNYELSNKIVESVSVNDININESFLENDFIKSIYYDLFIGNNKEYKYYNLSTRYCDYNENNVEWGIFSIKDGKLVESKLYNFIDESFESIIIIRPIIELTNNTAIYYDNNIWKIK